MDSFGAGRVAVVTGAARGIGQAIAARLLAGGMKVHALDLMIDAVEQDGLTRHRCDVGDLAGVEAVAKAIGRVDVLVNNAAAVTPAVPITELAPQDWHRAMTVNVTGLFNVTRSILPGMGQGGCIINLASTFGHVGSPGRVAYSTTKGAVLAFTRSLALDVAGRGIRVNSVSPGAVTTDRLVELFGSHEAAEAYLAPLHPIGRTGTPEDIANAVWFLASPQSSFMTGADLRVDGGYTAQ
jgi:NAD(P)-dependent dehydrogenase (short-subunit alcohol dehydrogenase family)